MKKTICTVLAAFTAVTLFSGCQTEKGVTKGEKQEILLGLPGGDSVTSWEIVENFKAIYSDKYDIKTDESSWADFTQKIKLQFVAKNDVVPVFFTDSMQAMTFGAQGAVLDLKDWVDKELDAEAYNKALFALSDEEGHLWGVPHALNSVAMLINKDILAERGVEFPNEDWTWEQMLDMAEKLTFDRDGDGKTDVYGIFYASNITQGWLPFMAAVGVSPYKNNFRDSNIDDPKVKEAMEKFAAPIRAGHLMNAAELSAAGKYQAAFADGKIAMGLIQASNITQINKFNPDLNYDAQIMPIGWNGERKCIYVPNVWQVYAGVSEGEKEACLEWLKFYLNEESQTIIAEESTGGFPIMKSALDHISTAGGKPEHIDSFYKGIDEYGMTILESPATSVTVGMVDNMAGKIRAGEDIDEWINTTHTDLQRELDYFYENQ